jgi:acetoin utilization deacetylase AcuC-like enzyme
MPTAIVTTPYHHEHDDPQHVEHAERLIAIEAALDASGLRPQLLQLPPRLATEEQLSAVHHPSIVAYIRRAAERGGGWIDQDTYTTAGSWTAALAAAGGAVELVEAVMAGKATRAFALVRPPGHHATALQPMGFCLFNNIAVAARYALSVLGVRRIAIVDFDVHHGNGTQDIFYEDPEVLFCSSHASPLYPGTGAVGEIGEGAGRGTTLNAPLPYGAGDAGFRQLYGEIILPVVRRFRPELLLVSAGYDAHWADPLGPLALSTDGYAWLTQHLADLADEICDGRVVFVLEGGYNLDALGASVVASLATLLGREPPPDPLGPSNAREPDLTALVERLKREHPLLQTS